MTYEEELQARLNATRPADTENKATRLDIDSVETKVLKELDETLSFAQYDLDESDLIRTLKIMEILSDYPNLFNHHDALKIFYVIAQIDVINEINLFNYCKIERELFSSIINKMIQHKLIFKNESDELEFSMDGKSLASRIGIDIFF